MKKENRFRQKNAVNIQFSVNVSVGQRPVRTVTRCLYYWRWKSEEQI